MSLRAKLKPPTHFLIYFKVDNSWFVASKSKVLYDGVPKVGNEYSVQWGSTKEVTTGEVISSGDWFSVRKKHSEMKGTVLQKSPQQPTKKRKQSIQSTNSTKKQKEECSVLKTVQPACVQSPVPEIHSPQNEAFLATPVADSQSDSVVYTPVLAVNAVAAVRYPAHSTPVADTPPAATTKTPEQNGQVSASEDTPTIVNNQNNVNNFPSLVNFERFAETICQQLETMSSTVSKKLDNLNKKVTSLEAGQRQLRVIADQQSALIANLIENQQSVHVPSLVPENSPVESETTVDNVDSGIPDYCRIPHDILRSMQREAKSAGNFALKIVMKLFPELFGPEKLRIKYNFNGTCGKTALDTVRKAALKRYVVYFYPEVNRPAAWQVIINAVNEGLRRGEGSKKKISNQGPLQNIENQEPARYEQLQNFSLHNVPPQGNVSFYDQFSFSQSLLDQY